MGTVLQSVACVNHRVLCGLALLHLAGMCLHAEWLSAQPYGPCLRLRQLQRRLAACAGQLNVCHVRTLLLYKTKCGLQVTALALPAGQTKPNQKLQSPSTAVHYLPVHCQAAAAPYQHRTASNSNGLLQSAPRRRSSLRALTTRCSSCCTSCPAPVAMWLSC